MLKKTVITVMMAMLIVFGAGLSHAITIDGMTSGTGPGLPGNLYSSVNPGGIGDSLLYGYYNVRGNLNLFNIVNTSSENGVKVRFIFRSAKTSKECLDFNVCLSLGDVWTAYLFDNGSTASIAPFDTDTITGPTIPSSGQPFKFGTYGPITVTADDCREGYFEAVGMSLIPNYDKNSSSTESCYFGGPKTNCIRSSTDCNNWQPSSEGYDAPNSLLGNNTIFELATLATYSYNATAVWTTTWVPFDVPSGSEVSIPFAMGVATSGAQGCDTADFIFNKSNVISPYDIMSFLGGETEVIITFPTRLACHGNTSDLDMFDYKKYDSASGTITEYCTNVAVTVWNDKEKKLTIEDFSPSVGLCLPHEVNVLKLGGSQIWNSTVALGISTGDFALGWINVDLYAGDSTHQIYYYWYLTDAYAYGLPAVAYTSQSFAGGDASYMTPAMYMTDIFLP